MVPALTVCARCPRSLLVPRALAMRLLGGFAGGFGLEGRGASAFPQIGDVCSEPRPQQTAQKPRLMSKSEPIFCKTVQKSWGAGIGHRAVAVEADFRAPVCATEGCTLPGSPSLCFCSVKRSCLIMWSWRASRGSVGASAGPPRFPSFPPLPARPLSPSPYSESGGNTRLQFRQVMRRRCRARFRCAAAVPVGSRHKSHVMRRGTRGWDAYSTERSPAQLNAKVVLEPPFGAATLPIMNRRSCIGAARKGCSCVFSNPGWG